MSVFCHVCCGREGKHTGAPNTFSKNVPLKVTVRKCDEVEKARMRFGTG